MITFDIKINGVTVQKVDAVRTVEYWGEDTPNLYEYQIYDYQKKEMKSGTVLHKYQDNPGILLSLIMCDEKAA